MKKIIMVVAATLGALALTASAAQAAPHSISCTFNGLAGIANPGVQAIVPDLSDGNLLDTDQGTFTFSGDAVCAGDTGAQTSTPLAASGSYVNTVCGTGTADGTANFTVGGLAVQAVFNIQFIAGQGVIRATVTTSDNSSGSAAGEATIVPDAPSGGDCVNASVTRFRVSGGFSGATT